MSAERAKTLGISRKGLYLLRGLTKQLVKFRAEGGVIRSDGGQHSRIEKRIFHVLFDLPHRLNNARFQQRIQVAEVQHLLLEGIKTAENLNVLLGKRQLIGVGKNFDQRDFKWRQRQ